MLGVGRLVAKKGFDVLVDACAVLRERGVPFEALIVGQEDSEGDALRRRIARAGPRRARPPARPDGPRGLLDEYRRAGALCMPCRLLPDDRDGIPNVLVEAMAAGAPVVATPRLGHPRAGPDGVNGLLVDPRIRRRWPTRWCACTRTPRWPTGWPPKPARRCASASTASGWPRAGRAVRRGARVIAVRPRPVLCVNEHEHRDRALAEAVAAGRFTHDGETRELGVEPDWLTADLPADEEWRIEWVKFYYGLDLADAFRATGERRFLEAWERLVASWIVQVPPDHDPSEVTARRMLNWIYAWQRLPEARLGEILADSIRDQARHVRATLAPERNHRTLELYALLIAGLALDDGDCATTRSPSCTTTC